MGKHGRGTTQKLPDGGCRVAVTMPDGRRVWRRARDEKDAAKKLRDLIDQREAGLDPSSQTLAEWLRSWLAAMRGSRNRRVRPRTLDAYTLVAERHIIPALGRYRLDRLSERHVQEWIDGSLMSPTSVRQHRAVLRRALNVAVRQRRILRNAAVGVELPKPLAFHGSPLTLEEAKRLLAATADDWYGPLWRTAIDSGLRLGELLGLTWDDIDWAVGTITVRAQLQRVTGRGWARVETKAERPPVVNLFAGTMAALKAHEVRSAAERKADWKYHGHVFVTLTGIPPQNATVSREFKAACRKAGIAERRFHDVRWSTDTLMAELDVPEAVRMNRLGHRSSAMTRHYSPVREPLDRAAADRLGEALG